MKNHIPHPSILNSNKRINWPILKTKIHIYFHLRIKVNKEQSWKTKKRKEKTHSILTNAFSKKKKKKSYNWNESISSWVMLRPQLLQQFATLRVVSGGKNVMGPCGSISPSLTARHMASYTINCDHSITLLSFSIFTIRPSLTLIIS